MALSSEQIKEIRKDGIMNIKIYSFNSSDQFSVINFDRTRKNPGPGTVDQREVIMKGSYTIRGNKIIYRIKRERKLIKRKNSEQYEWVDVYSTLENRNPEEMEMFWYYKVSDAADGGKQLLLSTSPDFLEPTTLTKADQQVPP